MNCAGGERGNGLTLFTTGLLACCGSDCDGEGAKRSSGGINGKCGGTRYKTGDGYIYVWLWQISYWRSIKGAFKGGERGG